VADSPFEGFGREFRRAMEEHGKLLNEEMKRVQAQMQSAMEQMKEEMERVGAELRRAMEQIDRATPNPRDWPRPGPDISPLRKTNKAPKKKRPRRKPPGTASAPVTPRPKPKPLVDGAEAPIE
jgi:hypothetical protein